MFCLLETTSQVFHGARGREKPDVVGAASDAPFPTPNKAPSTADSEAKIPRCAAGVVATTPDGEEGALGVVGGGDGGAVAALDSAEEVATTGAEAPATATGGKGLGVLHLKQWVLEPNTLAPHFGQGQSRGFTNSTVSVTRSMTT